MTASVQGNQRCRITYIQSFPAINDEDTSGIPRVAVGNDHERSLGGLGDTATITGRGEYRRAVEGRGGPEYMNS